MFFVITSIILVGLMSYIASDVVKNIMTIIASLRGKVFKVNKSRYFLSILQSLVIILITYIFIAHRLVPAFLATTLGRNMAITEFRKIRDYIWYALPVFMLYVFIGGAVIYIVKYLGSKVKVRGSYFLS